MVAVTLSAQPSLIELARAGNFAALAQWINHVLMPDGFYAQVDRAGFGCVCVQVELPAPRTATAPELRENLIRRVCHQIWQLNSAVIQGVTICGRLAGQTEVLWQQSVRLVTPANRHVGWPGAGVGGGAPWSIETLAVWNPLRLNLERWRDWQRSSLPANLNAASLRTWIQQRYKALRLLLLTGSAVTAFTLGCWFGAHQFQRVDEAALQNVARDATIASVPQVTEPVKDATPALTESWQGLARIRAILDDLPVVHPRETLTDRSEVVLVFGGDVNLDNPIDTDYAQFFEQLPAIRAADVTMVNLNTPLTTANTPRSNTDVGKADPKAIDTLTAAGVDVVNLANDRIMDYRDVGLTETLTQLKRADIVAVGAGQQLAEARRPQVFAVKGVRIAYLSYATADYWVAQDDRPGVNEALREHIAADIAQVRDHVDWVVVNYHWGADLASYPAHWQTDLAHFTIDAGADAIVGHHPAILQGAETYKGRPIVYSLGRLVHGDQYGFGGETALLRLTLPGKHRSQATIDRSATETANINHAASSEAPSIQTEFIPVEVWDGRPVAVLDEAANWIVQQIEDLSQGFAQPLPIVAAQPLTQPDPNGAQAEHNENNGEMTSADAFGKTTGSSSDNVSTQIPAQTFANTPNVGANVGALEVGVEIDQGIDQESVSPIAPLTAHHSADDPTKALGSELVGRNVLPPKLRENPIAPLPPLNLFPVRAGAAIGRVINPPDRLPPLAQAVPVMPPSTNSNSTPELTPEFTSYFKGLNFLPPYSGGFAIERELATFPGVITTASGTVSGMASGTVQATPTAHRPDGFSPDSPIGSVNLAPQEGTAATSETPIIDDRHGRDLAAELKALNLNLEDFEAANQPPTHDRQALKLPFEFDRQPRSPQKFPNNSGSDSGSDSSSMAGFTDPATNPPIGNPTPQTPTLSVDQASPTSPTDNPSDTSQNTEAGFVSEGFVSYGNTETNTPQLPKLPTPDVVQRSFQPVNAQGLAIGQWTAQKWENHHRAN